MRNPNFLYLYSKTVIGPCLGLGLFGGGPYNVPTSKNKFTEAGNLKRPSRLDINRDGCFKTTASIDILTETVALEQHNRLD